MVEPYYQDNHNTLYCMDFRKNDLPDECVQEVCTSPPYWGLRKYSGEQELIWGDKDCEHEWIEKTHMHNWERNQSPKLGISGDASGSATGYQKSNTCSLCGAWKGAYGLEPTPSMYVQHTIEILREIRRVLRKDGVVFWNIGDSYSGSGEGGGGNRKGNEHGQHDTMKGHRPKPSSTLKPKDLCLIPFRVAIAAQEDGWWVRSVIVWSKNNPMPESVTDRPTESHEYILMLTKSGTTQYWTHPRKRGSRVKPKADYIWTHKRSGLVVDYQPVSDRILREFWRRSNLWRGHDYYWDADAVREEYTEPLNRWGGDTLKRDTKKTAAFKDEVLHLSPSSAFRVGNPIRPNPSGRNIRSVWEFPTQPYPEAHFAVFPEKLPELCIKAATPEVGCCSKCGAPWERIREKTGHINKREPAHVPNNTPTKTDSTGWSPVSMATNSWLPTCKCNADKVPSICLDPFMGAGTTLWVAMKLNRKAIGFDTSEEYCRLTVDRIKQQVLL